MKTKPTRSFRHGATLLFVTSLLIAAAQTRAQAPNALEHTIAAPPTGAQSGAQLGYSVATEGNLTVVGAPFDDLQGINSGVVKVFDSSTGELLHVIANPSPAQNDQFGESVAISGTLVAVAARMDDTGATDAGSVYVYDLSSGTPTLPVATLNNPGPATGDFFGFSVSISGTLVVVGAFRDDTGATDAGSAYVYDLNSVTPTVPVATLNNPGPAAQDQFGESVSISGMLVVVGAFRDDTGAFDAGSAYVYDLSSGTPTVPVATLNNPSPAASDTFGESVSISGTLVVVGANGDDTGATDAGSAYVYDLNSVTPTVPVVTLNNFFPAAQDQFGLSVSISGTLVAVGASTDDTGATNAGSAYVYDLSSETPTVPAAALNNPGPATGDQFGLSVSISGTLVAVGAFMDDTGATNAGSAYVYDFSSGTPTVPVATLNNPGPAAGDQFGLSVAISGTLVVVGSPFDDTGATDAGSAYVYDLSSGTPTVPAATLNNPGPSAGDQFGVSVAISGTLVVVGANTDDTGATNAGSAYVYDLSSGTVPVATLNNPSPFANDQFGFSVSISGTLVVVGTRLDDTGATDAGSVYVYDLNSVTPTLPVATLNNPDPAAQDLFGFSVAISGTLVVVGANADDTGAIDAGSAYVYDLNTGTPTVPVATLNNPDPADGDQFGESVSISGTLVAVGAFVDDTGATNAGSAYVYDLSSGTPTVPAATLNNPGAAAGDQFGDSVSISGTLVVVGAIRDDTGATDAGSAYVYDLSSGTPTVPVETLNNPGPAAGDQFGVSVSISGTRAAIGAPLDDATQADKGSAYIFAPGNVAPVAQDQAVSTNEDTAKSITLTASDANGDSLTFSVVSGPTNGTLTGTAPNLTYTPNANYNGPDSFTFKANDGQVDSNTATVSITVTPVNDAPVANGQSVTTNEDTAKAITLSASDVDGNGLTFSVVTQPTNGTLSGTAPILTYTPNANYNGPDSFTFKANDGTEDSNIATVSITVTAVNDAPVANGQSVTTNEDTSKAIALSGSDVDGDALTFSVVTQPTNGTLSGTAPNLTYTPNANYNGPDSFTFKANDGTEDSNTATVSITVTAVNDAPVITAGAAVARKQGSAGTTATIATVSDQEQSAGSLTVTATNVPAGISVTGISNNSGTVTATVAADCSATVGANPVELTVTDSNGETSTASFMVNVTANTAATLTYNNAAVNKGASMTINPTSGPTDNGSVTSIVVQSQGDYSGTISVNSAGVVSVSNAAPKGFHTITIRATDNCNVTTNATFTLEVRQNKVH